MTAAAAPRAFVVWFRDLDRWSVGRYAATGWRWSKDAIRPLADALKRKTAEVDRKSTPPNALRLVTLHFDGEMEPRSGATRPIKGRLFWADPGDVTYSKIDVRNGAIGIVPPEMGRVCVTTEYPVYGVDPSVADARYIKLFFRTAVFRKKINGMISGASGRKRVQPSDLEGVEVPLPALKAQAAIIAAWESAQRELAATRAKIAALEERIEADFLADLGLSRPPRATLPKCFAVRWRDFLRWSVSYNQHAQSGADITRGKYPVLSLGSCLDLVQYGTSAKANSAERGTPVLRINNVKGRTVDTAELKHLELPDEVRRGLLLADGDILVIRTSGSRDLVGTCAAFHERGEYVFASYLIRLRADPAKANPDYIVWFLNSPLGRQQVDATSRQIMQNNINSQELRNLQIPLPPLAVQQAMMKRVNAGRAEIGALRTAAAEREQQAKADVEAMILGSV